MDESCRAAPAIAAVVIYVYGASLLLAPSLLWPWARWRRASPGQAVAVCLVVPLAWIVKECVAVGRVFSFGEAVYYAFNPLSFGLLTVAALQMAACELVWRRVQSGRLALANGPGLVVLAILLMGVAYGLIARAYGVTAAHYAYLEVYRWLFG
jgi:hypothetical protein